MPTSPDPPHNNEEVALSGGIALGVAGTTAAAVTVCCIWCACHRRRYMQHKSHGYTLPNKNLYVLILSSVHNCSYSNAWFLHLADVFYYRLMVA